MGLPRRFRFSMATAMMLVVAAAAASALFAKVRQHTPPARPYLKVDAPILFTLSIVLTAVGLASLKAHSANQTMLQVTVACLGFVSLVQLAEAGLQRPLLYWFQASFGLLVTLPLLGRRLVKSEMARGPRRDWWKRTFEAIFFAFLTMMLVLLGLLLQWLGVVLGAGLVQL